MARNKYILIYELSSLKKIEVFNTLIMLSIEKINLIYIIFANVSSQVTTFLLYFSKYNQIQYIFSTANITKKLKQIVRKLQLTPIFIWHASERLKNNKLITKKM